MSEETFGPQEEYRPVPAGPDPARDRRIAARRAEDARRAAHALDRLLGETGVSLTAWQVEVVEELFTHGLLPLQHNRAYGVPSEICPLGLEPGHFHVWQAGRCVAEPPDGDAHHKSHDGVPPCTCTPHPVFGHEDGCRYEGMGRLTCEGDAGHPPHPIGAVRGCSACVAGSGLLE